EFNFTKEKRRCLNHSWLKSLCLGVILPLAVGPFATVKYWQSPKTPPCFHYWERPSAEMVRRRLPFPTCAAADLSTRDRGQGYRVMILGKREAPKAKRSSSQICRLLLP